MDTLMFARICDWENLLSAFQKAARGKRGKPNVAQFEHDLAENLIRIRESLLDKSYSPGKYVNFYIHEPKRRLISAAPFRDRVVHHALCNVIEPVFERSFIADSYANRIGKGTHRALDRAQGLSRKFAYCLQCDIRQFFPSIDHEILYNILAKKVYDQNALWLVKQIMASGAGVLAGSYDIVCFPGDDVFALNRPRGLPIGNLTSQFWANCYLNPFDHFVKRRLRCKGYVRYVDDFVLFADSKRQLWEWLEELRQELRKLRLTIHPGAHPKPVTEGMPFLGFVVCPDRRRLKRRKGVYFQRKFKALARQHNSGQIALKEVGESVRGWVNHVRYANTVGLRTAIFKQVVFVKPENKGLCQKRDNGR